MDLTDNLSKQRASRFDETDDLAVLLLQVCGPSHIAFHDTRWQELLLGYEIWVHLDNQIAQYLLLVSRWPKTLLSPLI
jgi:hypothetical protein